MKKNLFGALLLLASCSIFSCVLLAQENKTSIHSGSASSAASLPGGLTPAQKMGCEIAEDARLSDDSARNSCDASKSINGGGLPPSNDFCAAPTTVVSATATQISAENNSPNIYSQEGARCTLVGTTIDNDPNGQTDCSGFATGVLLRSGAEIVPNHPVPVPFTTSTLLSQIQNSSCWTRVTGPPYPGDMCVYNNGTVGHVWFVDRVDTLNPSSCSRIESTGGGSDGVSGIQISDGQGPVSDNAGGSTGCNSKETNQNVFCGRPTGTPDCTDSAATNRRYKNEDKVMNCDVGGK